MERIGRGRVKRKRKYRYVISFVNFVVHPTTHKIRTTGKRKLLLTIRFYFLTLFFVALASFPLMLLEEFGLVDEIQQAINLQTYTINSIDKSISLLLIPIVASLLEETEFRLVLHRFNRQYLDTFISLLIGHLCFKLFGNQFIFYNQYYSVYILQTTVFILLFALLFYLIIIRTDSYAKWAQDHWSILFKILFYVLAFIFALGHLGLPPLK